jgi:hypothetical protein
MHPPVVDDTNLPYRRAAGRKDPGDALPEDVITEMPQVEGLLVFGLENSTMIRAPLRVSGLP